MTTSILSKLKIKSPHILYSINAPKYFNQIIGKLPVDISIRQDANLPFDSIHWFVKTKSEVDQQSDAIIKLLKPNLKVWCYFPKKTSHIQTDLSRDNGWEKLEKRHKIKWLSLISFNETWSAFAFRLDRENKAQPKEREILKYADSKTKTINLPKEISNAFSKNKKAKTIFDSLAFSHRREYVEWIVNAKREETKISRIEKTIQMLIAGKKNPNEK